MKSEGITKVFTIIHSEGNMRVKSDGNPSNIRYLTLNHGGARGKVSKASCQSTQ